MIPFSMSLSLPPPSASDIGAGPSLLYDTMVLAVLSVTQLPFPIKEDLPRLMVWASYGFRSGPAKGVFNDEGTFWYPVEESNTGLRKDLEGTQPFESSLGLCSKLSSFEFAFVCESHHRRDLNIVLKWLRVHVLA